MKTKPAASETHPINTPLQQPALSGAADPKPLPTVCPEASRAPAPLEDLLRAPNPADTALVPLEPNGLPASPVSLQLAPSLRRARTGKIARLPKPVRDVVNRMLSLNISQDKIVDALDELGICVNQQNISNWKTQGGYREWCLAQEHATRLRIHQDNLVDLLRRHDAPELPEVGLQAAATQLSRFFLAPDAQQLLASDPKEYERRVCMLNRIASQLKTLQKSRDADANALGSDHDPDRTRAETNSALERLIDAFTSKIGESPKDPGIPHRNLLPNPAELFNFTDRAPDDDSEKDSVLEFMKACYQRSPAPKPAPAAPPASNENTAPKL